MTMRTKVPFIMRQALSQYTDIRDELENFRDFLQDICCDIGGTVEEIDDQLDTLCNGLIAYNEAIERYMSLSDRLHSDHSVVAPDSSEMSDGKNEMPFPVSGRQETV